MGLLGKIWRKRWMLRSLAKTVYFNFHYLPLRQAVKLPILLYKPKLMKLRGRVVIEGPVRHGMVIMGIRGVSIYPNTGIIFENNGGTVTFAGRTIIGSASAISVGSLGNLRFGDDIMANAAIKIVCYNSITIESRCRFAWECMLLDTDFHALTKPDGSLTRGYAPIHIGHDSWLGTRTLALKGTRLAPYTTVQARTTLTRDYTDAGARTILGSDTHVVVKKSNIYRDIDNDLVVF